MSNLSQGHEVNDSDLIQNLSPENDFRKFIHLERVSAKLIHSLLKFTRNFVNIIQIRKKEELDTFPGMIILIEIPETEKKLNLQQCPASYQEI